MSPAPETKPDDDAPLRRRVIGIFLFPLALFPLLALVTYDWHAIGSLAIPPRTPTPNLIGAAGDCFAHAGYALLGLGVWAVPALCAALGAILVIGRTFTFSRRFVGLLLTLFTLTCLLQQFGTCAAVRAILHSVNIEPNAGGAIGHLVMTRGLASIVSPFGASVIMICLLAASLLMMVGLRNAAALASFVTRWASDRGATPEEQAAEDERRAAREAAKLAAKAAKEQAKKDREAEKLRIAEEKQRAEDEKRRQMHEEAAEAAEAAGQPPAVTNAVQDDLFGGSGDWLSRHAARKAARTTEPAPGKATPAATAPAPAAPAPTRATPATPAADAIVPADPQPPEEDKGPYVLPQTDLLNPLRPDTADHGDVNALAAKLIETLKLFDVDAELAYNVQGPVVTQLALTLAPGTKPDTIRNLSSTLQMALKAKSLRIQAPIPGENAVGIEVPNKTAAAVSFREIIESDNWRRNVPWPEKGVPKYQLPLLLGKDAAGHDLVADLATMPHLLVAGATGQGKSVCLNAIISGLLMSRTPEQLKFIMVDPKCVEFTAYAALPHLLVPVVTDNMKVVYSLRWAVTEMERRLKLFQRAGKRNIVDYNNRTIVSQPGLFGGEEPVDDPDNGGKVPYIVIIIDEVADLMQTNGKEVEPQIARLAAKARATGIHLILATQRPDTKVITGTIKSNIPGRIAFKTSQGIDSRTILDATGAEQLIGKGDMLFKTKEGILLRAQGAWVSDDEINRITDFIAQHANVQFDQRFASKLAKVKEAEIEDPFADNPDDPDNQPPPAGEEDDSATTVTSNGVPPPSGMTNSKEKQLYLAALDVVGRTGRASTSHLQRRMGIGYNHAARLIDLLEDAGVIGPARGAGPREILLDPTVILKMAQGETTAANDTAAANENANDAADATGDGGGLPAPDAADEAAPDA